jgi:hypothetical protein
MLATTAAGIATITPTKIMTAIATIIPIVAGNGSFESGKIDHCCPVALSFQLGTRAAGRQWLN